MPATTLQATAFQPGLFTFLRDLRRNNRRDWFQENKERHETVARQPSLAFIRAIAPDLSKIGPYVADPRPVGGSLFRIHRDTRFSTDKTPYKTHIGMHFQHKTAKKDVHVPGFYLHLEPGECWAGGGIWHGDPGTVRKIRDAIVARPDAWRKATKGLTLEGDALKRAPVGFDPNHPLIQDLRRKDFTTGVPLKDSQVTGPKLATDFLAACRRIEPLNAFLVRAVGL